MESESNPKASKRCGLLAQDGRGHHESDKVVLSKEDSPAQPKNKLQVHDIQRLPWAKVGMDLFAVKGKEYLIIVDYLTDFFEVAELSNTMAATVVRATKQQLARHGIQL